MNRVVASSIVIIGAMGGGWRDWGAYVARKRRGEMRSLIAFLLGLALATAITSFAGSRDREEGFRDRENGYQDRERSLREPRDQYQAPNWERKAPC